MQKGSSEKFTHSLFCYISISVISNGSFTFIRLLCVITVMTDTYNRYTSDISIAQVHFYHRRHDWWLLIFPLSHVICELSPPGLGEDL